MNFLYLALNLGSISIPFIYSFDKRLLFYKKWNSFFFSTALVGSFFIIWDVFFTKWGIWGFNPKYLIGVDFINLPIEEWMFFFCIPYACIFTYESLFYFIKNPISFPSKYISIPLLSGLALGILVFHDRLYTVSAFCFCWLMIFIAEFVLKAQYLNRFYFSYLIILIPFFIVNGFLTGMIIPEEVVWYNNLENIGIRMGTIPVEDAFYGMSLLLSNVMIYEALKKRLA